MAAVGSYATLAEAALTTQDTLVKGVIAEIVRDGGILDMIPVRTIEGGSLLYDRENVQPSGSFHAIADTWTASEDIDVTQVSTTLAIHGDQKWMDDRVARNYSNINDQWTLVTEQTSAGLRRRIERAIIYESSAFSGLHSLATTNQTISQGSGSTGAALTVTAMNRMLDLVRPQADVVVTPFRLAQRMDQAPQGVNSTPLVYIDGTKGEVKLGGKTTHWRGVPIKRSDFMATPDTGALRETIATGTYSAETGGATGSVFGIRFGQPEEGGMFLGVGNELFEMIGPYESENRNGKWIRFRTYLAPGLGSTRSLGRVDGCTDVAITA